MAVELLAIDLGTNVNLHGIDTDGVILSKKVSRAKLAEVVDEIAPRQLMKRGLMMRTSRPAANGEPNDARWRMPPAQVVAPARSRPPSRP
jgi:hypothetical protein